MRKKDENRMASVETAVEKRGPAAKGRRGNSAVAAKARRKPDAAPSGKLGRKEYEKELRRLQTELCEVQEWVKTTGQRIVLIFEGRDAAGKGGTIRAITERCSPRVFRITALPAPSDREKSQMYIQRYLPHFPAAGEIVIFDRSYYNRAGIERVLGFCTKDQHRESLQLCPTFERVMVDNGIRLIKYWLEVGEKEQERRFRARIDDPLRQWKLSPTDLESRRRWYDYSLARDEMFDATDTPWAPWHVVRSDSKKRGRLNCISHLLGLLPYKPMPKPKVKMPKRSMKRAYDDVITMKERRWIPEKYKQ
jgi:polyphosphate kinase